MGPSFNPERLQSLRRKRGLSLIALQEKTGVSAKSLSALESGEFSPSSETLAALSNALDVPSEYFWQASLAAMNEGQVSFRASSRLRRRDEYSAIEVARHSVELSWWISENFTVPSRDVPEAQDVSSAEIPLSPSLAARLLRSAWGLGAKPVGNVMHLVEVHGVKVFSAGYPQDSVDAFSFRARAGDFMLLNTNKSAERISFDIAHELGHLFLHSGTLNTSGPQREQEANEFASAFLMPDSDIVGRFRRSPGLDQILGEKSRWGVSAMALTYRLHKLSMLSDWTYKSYSARLSEMGYRRSEPGGRTLGSSLVLSQVVDQLRESKRGLRSVAADLAWSLNDVHELLIGLVPLALNFDNRPSQRSNAELSLVEDGQLDADPR